MSVLDDFSSELDALDQGIDDAKKEADEKGLGLLLTTDGDELKDAVLGALTIIGFKVADVDATLEEGEGKREDLWVEHDEEVVIAEVKGYKRGAKFRDLMRAKDYRLLYLQKHGSVPDGQWHIVNANRSRPPDLRPRLLEGHDEAVDAFGGLVIDTRDLFKLVRDIQRGDVAQEEALDLLWKANPGFFHYPTGDTEGQD
jgi:hypothetical protein